MSKKYYFENVDELVQHLIFKYKKLSPLKLQKSLYFLFAFYAGNYQISEEQGVAESDYDYPKYLFKADFEAWTYGPVIRHVYDKNKKDEYMAKEFNFEGNENSEISKFIDDVSEMIMAKSDFALVDRSHDDKAWKDAIAIGNSSPMSEEVIANEYKELFKNMG